MKLVIVRHGEPDYSIDSLTERGFMEAELLSKRIYDLKPDEVYVSPLGRARDTAAPSLKLLGKEEIILPWLREFPARIIKPWKNEPGCCWDWLPEVWTKREAFYDKDRWFDCKEMNQDDLKNIYEDVISSFDLFMAEHGYVREDNIYKAVKPNRDTIVLFCHFALECVLLSRLIGASPMVLWHGFCAAPTSVTTVYSEERRKGIASFRISSFGDVSHLYANGVEPSFAARFCETFDSDERHD